MAGSTLDILSTCWTSRHIEQSSAGRNIFCVNEGTSARHLKNIQPLTKIDLLTLKIDLRNARIKTDILPKCLLKFFENRSDIANKQRLTLFKERGGKLKTLLQSCDKNDMIKVRVERSKDKNKSFTEKNDFPHDWSVLKLRSVDFLIFLFNEKDWFRGSPCRNERCARNSRGIDLESRRGSARSTGVSCGTWILRV